jgi:hypothetical protein
LWEQNIINPVAHASNMLPISSLFRSFINTPDGRLGPQSDLIWTLAHDPSRSKTVSDTIADFLDQKSPDGGFTRLSDVFCIAMHKADRKHGQSGGEVLVELDETMFMGKSRTGHVKDVVAQCRPYVLKPRCIDRPFRAGQPRTGEWDQSGTDYAQRADRYRS